MVADRMRSKLMFNIISSHRRIFTGRRNLISDKDFQKIKLNQAKMQCDDGRPVFLKRGTRDKILYNITLGMTMIATVESVRAIRGFLNT